MITVLMLNGATVHQLRQVFVVVVQRELEAELKHHIDSRNIPM